jgi:hypothetical protein
MAARPSVHEAIARIEADSPDPPSTRTLAAESSGATLTEGTVTARYFWMQVSTLSATHSSRPV